MPAGMNAFRTVFLIRAWARGPSAFLIFHNPDEKVLTFSGAKMPLIYVNKGDFQIIRGDKQSIGYQRSDLGHEFKKWSVKLTG